MECLRFVARCGHIATFGTVSALACLIWAEMAHRPPSGWLFGSAIALTIGPALVAMIRATIELTRD